MRRMILSALFLCFPVVWATPARAHTVEFEVYKASDAGGWQGYFACIGVKKKSDFTNVQWWDDTTSVWKAFQETMELDEEWFDLETDDYSSLSDLNSAIGGAGKTRVHTAAGYATYTFTVNEVTEDVFPIVPAITPSPFPASVPQNYTFTWTWGGSTANVDGLYVELGIETGSGDLFFEADTSESEIAIGATQWTPNLSPHTGSAEFHVGYYVMGTTHVTDFTYDGGDSTIGDVFDFGGGDELLQFAASGNAVEFNLIADPTGDLPGDADGDGVVNAADYIALKAHMGRASGAVLTDGDFDEDGDVDLDDLQILESTFGTGSPGASGTIPEPATLGLLAFGAMAVLRRRKG